MALSKHGKNTSGQNNSAEPFRYIRYVVATMAVANLIALFIFNYGLPDPQVKSPNAPVEISTSEENRSPEENTVNIPSEDDNAEPLQDEETDENANT